MHPIRTLRRLALASLTGCAGAAPQVTTTITRPHPRRAETHEALSEAMRGAAYCLPRSIDAVTVHGEFRGSTGAFAVATIESTPALDERARNCVRQTFEAARVEPFTEERWRATRTFGPNGLAVLVRPSAAPPASASPAAPQDGGEGALDASAVAWVVRGHLSEIRRCYEQQLHIKPDFHGRVTVHFTIEPTGSASRVTSTSAMQGGNDDTQRGIEACIDRVFRGMTFPHPEGGSVDFTFPFNFAPGS